MIEYSDLEHHYSQIHPEATSKEEALTKLTFSPNTIWYFTMPPEERLAFLVEYYTAAKLLPTEASVKAEQRVEEEETQKRVNIEGVTQATRLFVPYRRGVYPQWNDILTHPEDTGISCYGGTADKLFHYLGIPLIRLAEVYQYREFKYIDGADGLGFTGNFADNGKQNLCNILGKQTEFYFQPASEPIVSMDSREVFHPVTS